MVNINTSLFHFYFRGVQCQDFGDLKNGREMVCRGQLFDLV